MPILRATLFLALFAHLQHASLPVAHAEAEDAIAVNSTDGKASLGVTSNNGFLVAPTRAAPVPTPIEAATSASTAPLQAVPKGLTNADNEQPWWSAALDKDPLADVELRDKSLLGMQRAAVRKKKPLSKPNAQKKAPTLKEGSVLGLQRQLTVEKTTIPQELHDPDLDIELNDASLLGFQHAAVRRKKTSPKLGTQRKAPSLQDGSALGLQRKLSVQKVPETSKESDNTHNVDVNDVSLLDMHTDIDLQDVSVFGLQRGLTLKRVAIQADAED